MNNSILSADAPLRSRKRGKRTDVSVANDIAKQGTEEGGSDAEPNLSNERQPVQGPNPAPLAPFPNKADCNLTLDHPLALAALIQSNLLKSAGAANGLQDAVVKAVAELAEAVKVEREQMANFDCAVAHAFQQITDGAKKAEETEHMRFAAIPRKALDEYNRAVEAPEWLSAFSSYEGALARRNSVSRKLCSGSHAVTVDDLAYCEAALSESRKALDELAGRNHILACHPVFATVFAHS